MTLAASNSDTASQILSLLPQQYPFRFLDRIVEVDSQKIVGEYTFDPLLPFYQGHFPGHAVTPPSILIETMAQTVVVAMGLHLIDLDKHKNAGLDPSEYVTLFTDQETEFFRPVYPGDKVFIHGEKLSWRFRKIRSKASLYLASGELVATGILSGMGVKKQ